MTLLQTIIIAIVEGLTEFLPVSSTGHMIIAQNLLGVPSTDFVKAFTVIIQFGAILSVVCLYYKRFFKLNHTPAPVGATGVQKFLHKWDFYWKLLVAFIPAAVLGFIFNSLIEIVGQRDGSGCHAGAGRCLYAFLRQNIQSRFRGYTTHGEKGF